MQAITPKQHATAGRSRDGALAYLLAAACQGLALLLRFLLDPFWKDRLPLVTFFVAFFIVTQFAGVGPSLLALVISFVLGDWFFIQPLHSL